MQAKSSGHTAESVKLTSSRPQRIAPWVLADELASWPGVLLLIDYDGTLSDLAAEPDAALTRPEALAALTRLQDAPSVAAAVISGRPLSQLPGRLPGLRLWLAGEHGAVLHSPAGELVHLSEPGSVQPALHALTETVRELLSGRPGWRLESKQTGMAIHYRQADPADARHMLPILRAAGSPYLAQSGLRWLAGNAVLEVRAGGADKGSATLWLAARFPGLRPAFFGDDLTDEDGFAAATSAGGVGVLVADRPRDSLAGWRLGGTAELGQFLTELAARRTR